MKKDKKIEEKEEMNAPEVLNGDATLNDVNDANEANEANDAIDEPDETEALKARIAELEDKNLRMMAEFDNYRRRTNKEKLDLMATAGERIFKEMLPLVDDFERATDAMEKTDDIESVREGIKLIQQKFISFLDKQDVHAIETDGVDFNTDEHEAITTFAAGEDKKGKVIDCTQKGYKLGDKVIRFAKVVVGE
ncbi:MAG: nucleotide exchange factor GrpE [Paludibacteraceae bacterium]|nr:nucleotide exchange factor GrpE [Paludibacteraceae bacterium]